MIMDEVRSLAVEMPEETAFDSESYVSVPAIKFNSDKVRWLMRNDDPADDWDTEEFSDSDGQSATLSPN